MRLLIIVAFLPFYITQSSAQCHPDDFTALRELYLNTDGDNWTDTTGWSLVRNNASPPAGCDLGTMSGIAIEYVSTAGNFGRVRQISLAGNNLAGDITSATLDNLGGLEDLFLLNNHITGFPLTTSNKANFLKRFYLSQNDLTVFPMVVTDLNKLETVNLDYNNMSRSTIPEEIENLILLEELSMKSSGIGGVIPTTINELTSLTDMDLSDNFLSGSIPREIGSLLALENLNLSNNQLGGNIPAQLGNLSNLTFLNLSDNLLTGVLPSSLGGLRSVYSIDVRNNMLSGQIPNEIGDLCNLVSFYGQSNQFTALPHIVGGCAQVNELQLWDNQIDSISDELTGLPLLEKLDLSSNALTYVGSGIGMLTHLKELKLNNNFIPEILSGLGSLDSLELLDLSYNEIAQVDGDIGGALSLRVVNFNDNNLTDLPIEFGNLQNLEYLSLPRNNFIEIPEAVFSLSDLKSFTFFANEATGIVPCQLGLMDSLMEIEISGNYFSGCFDPALASLCDDDFSYGTYVLEVDRQNDLPDWNAFCATGAYACPSYIDTVIWERYDTVAWDSTYIWSGIQVPQQHRHVVLPSMGTPTFGYSPGASRSIELPGGFSAEAYTLSIEPGVQFHCPQGSTLEVFSAAGYQYQSACDDD